MSINTQNKPDGWITYQIALKENRGSWALDALAVTAQGTWSDSHEDGGRIHFPAENAEYIDGILDDDDNVEYYREI